MRFSIIIPAYNAEAYLSRCLDSIFSQEYEDYEVIVINDGSSDGTAVLLEGYASKYPNLHVLTQSNQGMATARNRGLDAAQGDYILFVDSDDELMPQALSSLAPHLNGEDIIGFGTRILNEQTGATADFHLSNHDTKQYSGWEYFNRHRLETTPVHFVCIWQRAYKRNFLEDNSLRFADGLRRAEDDLFSTMVILHAQRVKTIADCLYIYHVRPGSITRSSDPKLDADSRRVHRILEDTFLPLTSIDKRVIYQVLASNYITRLTIDSSTKLSNEEWRRFRQECVTPRHRRIYSIARTSRALLRLYLFIASIIHR